MREETKKAIGYKPEPMSHGGYMLSGTRVPDDEVYASFRDEKGRYQHKLYRITETDCGIIHTTMDYTKPWFKALQRDRRREREEKEDELRWAHITKNSRYPAFYDSYDCEYTLYGLEKNLKIRESR